MCCCRHRHRYKRMILAAVSFSVCAEMREISELVSAQYVYFGTAQRHRVNTECCSSYFRFSVRVVSLIICVVR